MAEVGKPGTNWTQVTPENRRKIDPIVRHYMTKPHPFTACVRDNTKRFGKDRAERICAVVKDMGMRTTKWRKGRGVRESAFDVEQYVEGVFDTEWAPVLDAEGVTVDELADWSKMAADAGIVETPRPKPRAKRPARKQAAKETEVADPLAMKVDTGDLSVLETAANPGVTRWGTPHRPENLPGNRRQRDRGRRRGGSASNQEFERAHPRGRGGQWVVKQGATGDEVRVIQRRVGAKADGDFGAQTRQRVMDFQRRHGLKVDGVVGRQTIAAMRGDANALHVSPGAATRADRRWLVARAAMRRVRETPATSGPLALKLDEDLRLVESSKDRAIHESAPLTLVTTPDAGHADSELFDLTLLEAAVDEARFNEDGTIDMVLIRPCNGRGVGNRIYEADVLRRDAPTFAGLAMYDNHESPAAARARQGIPRAPSELAGEIREAWWDDSFTTPDDEKLGFGRGAVIGRVMLTEDAEKLVRRLPRQIKTSVNSEATGFRRGSRNGKEGLIVEGFVNDPERHSVDLVTRAGAGGAVASLYRDLAAA